MQIPVSINDVRVLKGVGLRFKAVVILVIYYN